MSSQLCTRFSLDGIIHSNKSLWTPKVVLDFQPVYQPCQTSYKSTCLQNNILPKHELNNCKVFEIEKWNDKWINFKELQCRLHLNCINFTESVYRISVSLPVCETTGSVVPPSPRLLTHWLPDTVLNVRLTILWLIPSPVSVDCFSTRPDIPPCQTLQLSWCLHCKL